MRTQSLLSFLFETPFKFWKQKQTNLSQDQLTKAKEYFDALTGQLKDYISGIDLTKLSLKTIELLYLSIPEAKNFGIRLENGGKWLVNQIVKDPSLPIENVIKDINKFNQLNKDKKDINGVSNIQELNSIVNSLGSEICITATEAELGKIIEKDGWEVFLPHTTEASIVLGKRHCGKRDNLWCTTLEDAQNLFLDYALNKKAVLFYIIKKGECADKGNPEHKMSVGFIDGEPQFGADYTTVDAKNVKLTFKRYQQILGIDLSSEFLRVMMQKVNAMGNQSPASKEMEMLVATPEKFKQKFEGYKDDETGNEARKQIAYFALQNNKTSPEVIMYLATYKLPKIRKLVASNTKISEVILAKLAGDTDASVRHSVAENESTPGPVLAKLVGDTDASVRHSVAKHPNTPGPVLAKLVGDTDASVRRSVAQHTKTPRETLEILAGDTDDYVLGFVAVNPNTPETVLAQFTQNKNMDIRRNVARNPKTPGHVLEKLAGEQLAEDTDDILLAYVAQNQNTPESVLEKLAKSQNEYILSAVASNAKISEKILDVLALSSSERIGRSIATNPKTPGPVLEKLAGHTDEYVRFDVAKNRKTPVPVLAQLAGDTVEGVRRSVAGNPNTPEDTLIQLSKEKAFHNNLASNPNTPLEVLKILANNPYIRAIAIENAQKRNLPLQESKVYKHKIKLSSILF